jgi:dipeptidyl aminopeptidase/acylaminoacyl peptidase
MSGSPLRSSRSLFASAMLAIAMGDGFAAEPTASATGAPERLGIAGETFLVGGRAAFVFLPPAEKQTSPQPWIMYAPTLPDYPDIHEQWMHQQFVARGVAVAGIDAGEAYGSPDGQAIMTDLYRHVTQQRDFATEVCLVGRSRGGLWVSSWAIANPEKVCGIAGIYPVFDLRTYPGLERAAPAYQMSPSELKSQLATYNPIARIDVLVKSKLPLFIIHGDQDRVVPLEENSATVARHYRDAGAEATVTLVVAKGQGHNYWQGFFRCQELVDFAVGRALAAGRGSQR